MQESGRWKCFVVKKTFKSCALFYYILFIILDKIILSIKNINWEPTMC